MHLTWTFRILYKEPKATTMQNILSDKPHATSVDLLTLWHITNSQKSVHCVVYMCAVSSIFRTKYFKNHVDFIASERNYSEYFISY